MQYCSNRHYTMRCLWFVIMIMTAWNRISAFVPPDDNNLAKLLLVRPDVDILVQPSLQSILPSNGDPIQNPALQEFLSENGYQWEIQWDLRSDRPEIISGSGIPFIPGPGNSLTLEQLQWNNKPVSQIDRELIIDMAYHFIMEQNSLLKANPDNLRVNELNTQKFGENNRLWFIHFQQYHDGIPVKDSDLFIRVNAGNIIQFGTHRYFPVQPDLSSKPAIHSDDALEIAIQHAETVIPGDLDIIMPPELVWIQTFTSDDIKKPGEPFTGTPGQGYSHRLVWELKFRIAPYRETWFATIDAQSGNILSFLDDNKYESVSGGVYPVTNIDPEIQLPFPFTTTSQGEATSGGRFNYSGGSVTSTLNGRYVQISDDCGSINLSSSGDLDFGMSGGDDCTTPGFGGSGNTHSARSCFYHVNQIMFKGRGYLPSNTWLTAKLRSNVNIDDVCNAYWDGSSINFFKSGGGCSNTGEIASVFLHEWGHGLDYNTGTPSSEMASAEALADSMSFLQTHISCIGHNFHPSYPCDFGCDSNCTGVRDAAVRPFVRPSNIHQTPANCDRWECPYWDYNGIMGYEGHCEALISGGAIWDAANKLAAEYGAAGWALANRIFFETMGDAGAAYQIQSGGTCNPNATINGCGSRNWYTVWLAADDDNGNLSDGTPNGCLIWDAFNDHGIACGNRPVCYTACGDLDAPVLAVAGGNNSATLIWPSVPGAQSYIIYRNTLGCDFEMNIIGQTSETQYTDASVANDFTYYYAVQATGLNDACRSNFSNCMSIEITGCINPPLAEAGPNQSACPGDAVPLGGTPTGSGGQPPFQYIWTPGDYRDANPVVYPELTTVYTVMVIDAIGCIGVDTVTVTVDAPPVDAGADQILCSGYCVQIGSSPVPGYSYSWTPQTGLDDPYRSNPMACVSENITYTLVVTAPGYQCHGRDRVTLHVDSPVLEYIDNQIISDSGDADGAWESGERVEIQIMISNASDLTAYDVIGQLYPLEDLIYPVSESVSFGDVTPGESATAIFEAILDSSHPCPGTASFDIVLDACGHFLDTRPFTITLGRPGGLVTVYSNGFEGSTDEEWTHFEIQTQDDWQHGSQYGTSQYDPEAAYEGSRLWGNDLGEDGWNGDYKSNVNNYLLSPVFNCSDLTGVRIRFMRWLTVEEAMYDQATIYVNGHQIWQNEYTGHHIDTAWTQVEYDISAYADNNPNVQIKFEIVSDGGLEFGGWNIDAFELLAQSPAECDPFGCDSPLADAGADRIIAPGSAVQLDASGSTMNGCVSGIEYRWRGGDLGAGEWRWEPAVIVFPEESTTFSVDIRCSGSLSDDHCESTDTVSVYISGEPTPTAPPPTATMPAPTATPPPRTYTPTPQPTSTPSPTPTNTPTNPTSTPTIAISSTPTFTPTPTPTEGDYPIFVNLLMPITSLTTGDQFVLSTLTQNNRSPIAVDEYLALEVYGNYWFYPNWTSSLDYVSRSIETGIITDTIFNFVWPQVGSSAGGLHFYYLLTEPGSYQLLSNIGMIEFGYY